MNFFGGPRWRTAVRSLAWVITACVVGLAAYHTAPSLKVAYEEHAQVRTTPFTLQREFYSFDEQHPDGWLGLKETVARQSGGATATINEGFGPSGSSWGRIRAVDSPEGVSSLVYDDIGEVVRMPKPPARAVATRKQALTNPPSNCVSPGGTLVGYDAIHGYKVAIVRAPQHGSMRLTVWKAPSLGCALLRSLSENRQPDGSYTRVGETKLVSIVAGDPDPSLFDVPSGYPAVMPSQALRKEIAHLGRPWTAQLENIARTEDAGYIRQQEGQWTTPSAKEILQNPSGASGTP